jgi:drug/metabolite transporter (DMT)-like permease
MTIIWGSNFTAIKYSLDDMLPLAFNGLRFVIASTVMLIAMRMASRGPRVSRRDLWRLFGIGLIGNTFYQSVFILGLDRTRAGNAALIIATTPLFTALYERFRGQEYFTRMGIVGLWLAFSGIVLVIIGGNSDVSFGETAIGDLMVLSATISWVFYTVGSRPLVEKYGSMKATAIMMSAGTPPLLLICAPSLLRQDWSQVGDLAWAGVIYSALLAVALAYLIWNYGVRRIGSTRTAIYSNFTPVVAMLVAWPALGEVPTAGQLVGAAVIFAGIYLVRGGMIAGRSSGDKYSSE